MEVIRRRDIPIDPLPGRKIQRIVGKGASLESGRMTVVTAHYSDDSGTMEAHQHAEETIYILDARQSRVRFGPSKEMLLQSISLESGMTLHIPELEWHVFEWEPGGSTDCIAIYGQVDNIRPEDISRA